MKAGWKQNVYEIIDDRVLREGVSLSVQKDGQKVLNTIHNIGVDSTVFLKRMLEKYGKDKGMDQGGGGAGPGRVKQARRGAVGVWEASRRALNNILEKGQIK